MSSAHTPLRTEIQESDKWDLTPLYTSDAGWEEDFSNLQESYAGITSFRGKLGESAEELAKCLEFEKSIDLLADQLNQYAALSVSGDSSNAEALAREARLDSLMVRVGQNNDFFGFKHENKF